MSGRTAPKSNPGKVEQLDMFGDPDTPPIGQAGDCIADPPNQQHLELRTGRSLLSFYLARYAERFYCSIIVQCPLTGYSKPFIAAPAHTTPANALNERIKEVVAYCKEHDKSAIKGLLQWSPAIWLGNDGEINFASEPVHSAAELVEC